MTDNNSILSLKGVNYRYPGTKKRALKAIDLEVKPGEFVGIVGANGSGRSTLCYCINGLVPNAIGGKLQGEVKVRGIDIKKSSVPEIAQWVGMVFANPEAQLTQLSVADEIAFGPANLGVPLDQIMQLVKDILKIVQLEGLEERNTHTLSGGQQQRLAIGSVLAMKPEILVLDEPTSNLDPQGVLEVYSTVDKLNKENNTTVIMAEHAVDMLAQFASRILAMDNGKIIADGPPEEVFSDVELLTSAGIQAPEIPLLFHNLQVLDILNPSAIPVTVDQGYKELKSFLTKAKQSGHKK
ncbi:MAG: ATP-binding cassette domain-containing protein [Anaerolineaceae bacterium]|nr:ATP-binding cassette domain-containing protein [Anaerolineaceae bacterium]